MNMVEKEVVVKNLVTKSNLPASKYCSISVSRRKQQETYPDMYPTF